MAKGSISGPGITEPVVREGSASNKKVAKGMAAGALLKKMRSRGFVF